jgi:hypothetical protein
LARVDLHRLRVTQIEPSVGACLAQVRKIQSGENLLKICDYKLVPNPRRVRSDFGGFFMKSRSEPRVLS